MSPGETTPFGFPRGLGRHHVLALPPGADPLVLATAWFGDPHWIARPTPGPASGAAARVPSGARFRGMVAASVPPLGELSLTLRTSLHGPVQLDAAAARDAGLPAVAVAVYAVAPRDGGEDEPEVLGWMAAAARRVGGVIVPAEGEPVHLPEPGGPVELTLWSAVAVTADEALGAVRPALTGARVAVVPTDGAERPEGPPDPADPSGGAAPGVGPGPRPFTLHASYEYDGEVWVTCARSAEVALVLTSFDWRDYGPFAYCVSWRSPVPDELESDRSSPLHLIARGRIAPHVARAVLLLARSLGGVVVDVGGFVVDPDELARRAAGEPR